MTDYTKLVKAFRIHTTQGLDCDECPYYDDCRINGDGEGKMIMDAAAAIEALQAQLPKRGEWIRKDAELYYWHECSKCGERPLYDRYANRVLSAYCPNCGAEMERADEK